MFPFSGIIIGPEGVLYPGKMFCILDVVKVCAMRVKVKIFNFSFLLISCLKRYILSMAATSDISIRFMYNSLLRTHGLFFNSRTYMHNKASTGSLKVWSHVFNSLVGVKARVSLKSLHTSLVAHQAGAYPGFSSMKRLGVFLLPPGWDASPSKGYPQHQIRRYPFIHLGGERHCESEVSCPSTQHNVPGRGQGSNLERSLRSREH